MMVITVSRSYGSAGSLFARRIADALGFVYVDEEFVNKIGRDPEVSGALLMSLEDEPSPSLLQRSKDLLSRKSFFKLALSACIYDFALKHDIVFVGGGAHFVLEHYPGLLSIQVVRNMSDRIRDISADKNISYEEALDLIEQKDRAKNKFIGYYFDSDLFDPLKFHITFNASLVSLDEALTFSVSLARRHFSEVNREEAQIFLQRKLLEKKAEILLAGRDSAGDFGKVAFEATSVDTLIVKGVIGSEEKKRRLLKALWNLRELKGVEDQLKVGVLSRLIY
jgi:cytidylate kinase